MQDVTTMPGRVETFLAEREPDRSPVVCTSYEPMAGGYSRVMARASVTWADGASEELVLRGDPPSGQALIDTDRAAEWSIHSALSELGHVRVPAARHYDDTGNGLGTKCIVMSHCEGLSLQAHVEEKEELAPYGIRLAEQLASIHNVDVDQLPETMGRPEPATVIPRLVAVWEALIAEHVNTNPVTRYVVKWLAENKPAPMANVLVHGDFQNPNVMIDSAQDLTMVDWEFAHLCDPREDLGWYNIYSSVVGTNLYAEDPEAFLETYRTLTGFSKADVNQLTVGYFTVAGAARVSKQIVGAIDALARDELNSTMAAHQAIGATSQGNALYLEAVPAMDQALRAIREAGAS
ncbi:MAG: phosphotransferase family protein [Acidimicrobiales bacterium]